MINKKAFNMAEVLITLTLIGIVAAVTIPSIFINYQNRTKITKAKKAKFEVSQAAGFIQIQHPRWRNGDAGNVRGWFNDYLKTSSDIVYWYQKDTYSNNVNGCGNEDNTNYLLIGADIDKDDVADVLFCASSRGEVKDSTQCSLSDYETNKKPIENCKEKVTEKGQ